MSRPLLKKAIIAHGVELQLRMVQEECAELIAAINRYQRGRIAPVLVAEEIADVQIMAEQAEMIIGPALVRKIKAEKLARLKQSIQRSTATKDPACGSLRNRVD